MRTRFDELESVFPLIGFFRVPERKPCGRCGEMFDVDFLLSDSKYGQVCAGCADVLYELRNPNYLEENDEGL